MNKQEQFDKWVRQEVESLDNAPTDFSEPALWQKLQTELHAPTAVTPAKNFFVMLPAHFVMLTRTWPPVRASKRTRTAAAVLLIVAAGLWWQWPTAQKGPLVATAKPTPPLRGTPPRRGLAHQFIPAKSTPPLFGIAPTRELAQLTLPQRLADSARALPQPPTIELVQMKPIVETKELPTIEIAQKIAVPETKPKFKVVHANELADYQRAELAEVREKEAKKNGFIVINWKQKGQESDNNLMTYLRNKNKKMSSSPRSE